MVDRFIGGDLVVASTQVLDERAPGRDGAGGAVPLETTHRSKSGLGPTMIGLNRVVAYCSTQCNGTSEEHPRSREIMAGAERHSPGDRWLVDETYVKVGRRWRYLYRAIDQHGQVIDVLPLRAEAAPVEVTTDRTPTYPRVLDELIPHAHGRAASMNSGGEALHPPVDTHMINRDTALGEQLLDIPVGQRRYQRTATAHFTRERNPASAED
jgi:hypothetical protein